MKETEIDWNGVSDNVIGYLSPKDHPSLPDYRKPFFVKRIDSVTRLSMEGETESGELFIAGTLDWDYYERPKEKQFPKAGTRCQVHVNTETWNGWVDCFIVGMDAEGFCVYAIPQDMYKHLNVWYDGESNPENFRPITEETEKEKELLDKVSKIVGNYNLARAVVECVKNTYSA